MIPALGAYITIFGSTEGGYDLIKVRQINDKLFPSADEPSWPLLHLQSAFRAWWLAEYSGFYLDDPPESAIPPGTDLDEEDRMRSQKFIESLKDGAFDFLLSIAGDIRPPDWHDSVRTGMRKWLQRKSTALPADSIQFSDFFQSSLMSQLEVFVDAFISNLPDVLRKLRVEEDEQRQLSQAHEQDLDLERFLLIIAYAYEGRPTAASSFWSDPDSNLAGFMHWASRRASTPLVAAFCEMLQSISENDECATAAHEFLLDEGHHSSGKMRRAQSLTWTQIFKELEFFSEKMRHKPTPAPSTRYRANKPANDVVETEPESAMMLECYLRLMSKLASESEATRVYLLQNGSYNLVDMLFELASSPIPSRLRGCVFTAFKAFMARKSLQESHLMWACLENWISGGYTASAAGPQRQLQSQPAISTERILDEMANGFEDPESFIQMLLSLVAPAKDTSPLNDSLPFSDNLGSSSRHPGVEIYVDFVVGVVFATKLQDLQDVHQTRVLRLTCLDFMLTCLSTFNEDLIVLANQTSINIDNVIAATDLATYVKKHPFARVMEWMYNDKVMTALFSAIHQDQVEIGNAAPDSPLILGVLRAVEVISKVLDLEATYKDLVKPLIKQNPNQHRQPVANAGFTSFEDGLVTRLNIVVDLGTFCGMGHPDLTLASLKLLEKMSSSPTITATWSGSPQDARRNKAIVAMEANGEYEAISRSFMGELMAPLEANRESESASYITKSYILGFLFECLQATPRQPTIAHLLLGFKCGVDRLSVDPSGTFASRTALFHGMLRLLLELPSDDTQGMRQWLLSLKSKIMSILQILWSSPLSAKIVTSELRENQFLFHLLMRETVIEPDLPWEGQQFGSPYFPVTDGAATLVDFLALRSTTLEYFAMELCMISQSRIPSVKRRIFEALNGQIIGDNNERIQTPTVFDLYDFLLPDGLWDTPVPQLQFYGDLDLSMCVETDSDSIEIRNIDRVKQILLLKRSEMQTPGTVISVQDLAALDREETAIIEHILSWDRRQQITAKSLKVLKSWSRLLLVMVECNDYDGTARTSFFLQSLQAILPSLEAFAIDRPAEAMDLAKLARIMVTRLDLTENKSDDRQSKAIGNLIGDKLFQLFQICLQAVGSWAGMSELRTIYYEICYRYLAGVSEDGSSTSSVKAIKAVQAYGERLINVICDDAHSGEPTCQAAAYVLLTSLIEMGKTHGDYHVVETLNRLNFIGILVDSIRDIMQEWHRVFGNGTKEQQNHLNALLALLQQLAQTRAGSKYILYANLFRSVELSNLFSVDPELQVDETNPQALEQHYDLLAKVTRIIGATVISRGSNNIAQGRKFLSDHRMLVTHTLKRSAGIGAGEKDDVLEERVEELADALIIVIAATGFLEVCYIRRCFQTY